MEPSSLEKMVYMFNLSVAKQAKDGLIIGLASTSKPRAWLIFEVLHWLLNFLRLNNYLRACHIQIISNKLVWILTAIQRSQQFSNVAFMSPITWAQG